MCAAQPGRQIDPRTRSRSSEGSEPIRQQHDYAHSRRRPCLQSSGSPNPLSERKTGARSVRGARPSVSRAGTVTPLSVRTLIGGDVGAGPSRRPNSRHRGKPSPRPSGLVAAAFGRACAWVPVAPRAARRRCTGSARTDPRRIARGRPPDGRPRNRKTPPSTLPRTGADASSPHAVAQHRSPHRTALRSAVDAAGREPASGRRLLRERA